MVKNIKRGEDAIDYEAEQILIEIEERKNANQDRNSKPDRQQNDKDTGVSKSK